MRIPLGIAFTEEMIAELRDVAKKTCLPVSAIVRQCVRRELPNFCVSFGIGIGLGRKEEERRQIGLLNPGHQAMLNGGSCCATCDGFGIRVDGKACVTCKGNGYLL